MLTPLRMTESDFQKLLRRYLAGDCTPPENRLVEQWYAALDQQQPGRQPIGADAQTALLTAMWQRVDARTQRPAPATPAAWQWAPVRWAAAAVLLCAVGVGLWLFAGRLNARPAAVAVVAATWVRHDNSGRRVQVLTLPDGSRVELSPGSRLRYAAHLAGPQRTVYLSGEAFFDVTKNPARPFLVLTRQVVTTVLGTSFRVKAYAGSPTATVAVRTGRVAVQARAGAQLEATPARPARAGVLLLPNQQVVYSPTTRRLQKALVSRPVVLAPQSFVFDDQPVAEVLAALEKAYGVRIDYDRAALAGTTVTLNLTTQSLYGKLGVLCETLGASYEALDGRILLRTAHRPPKAK